MVTTINNKHSIELNHVYVYGITVSMHQIQFISCIIQLHLVSAHYFSRPPHTKNINNTAVSLNFIFSFYFGGVVENVVM